MDDKAFDSDDRKSVYECNPPNGATDEEVYKSASGLADNMSRAFGNKESTVHYLEIKGDGDKFSKILMESPPDYMQRKVLPK